LRNRPLGTGSAMHAALLGYAIATPTVYARPMRAVLLTLAGVNTRSPL
jgi:hypothetical protein